MKHKTLTILLVVLMSIAASVASAHDFEVDGIYYNITSSNTVAVTFQGDSYDAYSNEYSGKVVIPESVMYDDITYNVTSISDGTFYGCSRLTTISIPSSVIKIGNEAFYDTAWYENQPNGVVYAGQVHSFRPRQTEADPHHQHVLRGHRCWL